MIRYENKPQIYIKDSAHSHLLTKPEFDFFSAFWPFDH